MGVGKSCLLHQFTEKKCKCVWTFEADGVKSTAPLPCPYWGGGGFSHTVGLRHLAGVVQRTGGHWRRFGVGVFLPASAVPMLTAARRSVSGPTIQPLCCSQAGGRCPRKGSVTPPTVLLPLCPQSWRTAPTRSGWSLGRGSLKSAAKKSSSRSGTRPGRNGSGPSRAATTGEPRGRSWSTTSLGRRSWEPLP